MKTIDCVIKRLNDLCRERNISFNGLATVSGISASTVKNILNGKSVNPGVVTIKKICDGLDITLVDFFNTDYFLALEQEIE